MQDEAGLVCELARIFYRKHTDVTARDVSEKSPEQHKAKIPMDASRVSVDAENPGPVTFPLLMPRNVGI